MRLIGTPVDGTLARDLAQIGRVTAVLRQLRLVLAGTAGGG